MLDAGIIKMWTSGEPKVVERQDRECFCCQGCNLESKDNKAVISPHFLSFGRLEPNGRWQLVSSPIIQVVTVPSWVFLRDRNSFPHPIPGTKIRNTNGTSIQHPTWRWQLNRSVQKTRDWSISFTKPIPLWLNAWAGRYHLDNRFNLWEMSMEDWMLLGRFVPWQSRFSILGYRRLSVKSLSLLDE